VRFRLLLAQCRERALKLRCGLLHCEAAVIEIAGKRATLHRFHRCLLRNKLSDLSLKCGSLAALRECLFVERQQRVHARARGANVQLCVDAKRLLLDRTPSSRHHCRAGRLHPPLGEGEDEEGRQLVV
jgi:hypothetical protein